MDNSSLLAEYVRTRDPSLFQKLIDRYQSMVRQTCRRQLGNEADAEEATQEVFRALFVHAADIRSNLSGWLYKTSLNTARETLRSNISRNKREQAKAVPIDQADLSNHTFELAEAITVCLQSLEPEAINLIVNHFVLRKSQATIASELGVNPSTVSRRIELARRELRKRLEQKGIYVSISALTLALGRQQSLAAAQGAVAGGTAAAGKVAASAGTRVAVVATVSSKPWLFGATVSLLMVLVLTGTYLVMSRPAFEPAKYQLTTLQQVNRNMSVYPDRNGGTVLVQTVTQIGQKRPPQENDRVAAQVVQVSNNHAVKLFGRERKILDEPDPLTLPEGWEVSKTFHHPGSPAKAVVLGKSAEDHYGLFLVGEDDTLPIASRAEGFLYFYGAAAYGSGTVTFSALHEDDPPGMNVAGVYVWDGQSIRAIIRPGEDYSSSRVIRAFLFRGTLDLNGGVRMALDFGPDAVQSVIVSAKQNSGL